MHPQPVRAFRLAEYVSEHARRNNTPVLRLPLWNTVSDFHSRLVVVIAGKYMTKAAAESLSRYVEKGGNILFPFEAPQYDEEMQRHEWGSSRDRVSLKYRDRILLRSPFGKGAFWTASPAFNETDRLWDEIKELGTHLSGEQKPA